MSNNLSLRVLPRFPARISATNGLTIDVENGVDLVVKPDFGSLVPVPAATNPATTYVMAWDQSIDYYQSISFQDFADNLADQVLVGTVLALKNVTMAANQGIYFSDANTAHAYSLSAFVRGISGSADAAAFKTSLSLVKADVGLGNVDNTSDANKPVSTATQTALNLKADLASPALTGTPTAPTAAPGTNTTQLATTAFVTAAVVFTKQFDSAQQTITSAGAITVAHGLGALPKLIQILLICTTADAGYSVGDVIPVAFNGPANNNNSVGATYDTTNINLRYGSNASVFTYLNKTTGASTALTNGSWRMIVRAWA